MSKLDQTGIDTGVTARPPNEAEMAAWRALTRDEQVRLYQEALAHPDCGVATDDSMEDILAEAKARLARRRG
jgi:hypothetical protein